MNQSLQDKMISRTFWLTVGICIASTLLVYFAKIESSAYQNIVQWVLSSYAIKSVSEKFINKDS